MDGIIADSRKRRFDARHKGQHEKNNPLFKRYLVIALLLLVATAHPARAQPNQTTNLVAQGKTGLQAQSAGEDKKRQMLHGASLRGGRRLEFRLRPRHPYG